MALRTFTDSAGTEWKVWDVIPSFVREQEERVASEGEAAGQEKAKPGLDRSALLTPGLERGWLCFECDAEKRRLVPIPPDWADRPDEDLEALCQTASVRPQIS